MENLSTTQSNDAALEGLVQQILDAQANTDAAVMPADISASVAIGPQGAGMQGWLTYERGKIYMKASTIERYEGLFAGGGGLPRAVARALPPERLAGKTGRFEAVCPGALQVWLDDGTPVFHPPLPIAGIGGGRVRGTVAFERHD